MKLQVSVSKTAKTSSVYVVSHVIGDGLSKRIIFPVASRAPRALNN